MPFQKRFLILSGVAAFLGLTLVLGLVFQHFQRSGSADRTFLNASIDEKNLASFSVARAGQTISLAKIDNAWWIATNGDNWPARASRVEDFLASLKSMKSTRSVAQTAKGYAELGIDDAQATTVNLSDASGSIHQTLLFGSVSADGSEQYLRDKLSPTVWATRANGAFWLQQEASYWQDKRVWPETLIAGSILGVQYQSAKTGTINLTKQSQSGVDSWKADGAKAAKVNQDRTSAWIQNLLNLDGDELVPINGNTAPAGFTESIRISVRAKADKSYDALVYAPIKTGDPWLLIPQYPEALKSKNGTRLAIKLAEWKLQRTVMGDE